MTNFLNMPIAPVTDIFGPRPVAFLQNQWFPPDKVEKWRGFMNGPAREKYLAAALFWGCVTGRRLEKAFGDDWRQGIVWENVSREIGSKASDVFEPDPTHCLDVIRRHNPPAVLLFGKVAQSVSSIIPLHMKIIRGPHPAARQATVPEDLRCMVTQLGDFWERLHGCRSPR